jgi:hypothetical protein
MVGASVMIELLRMCTRRLGVPLFGVSQGCSKMQASITGFTPPSISSCPSVFVKFTPCMMKLPEPVMFLM